MLNIVLILFFLTFAGQNVFAAPPECNPPFETVTRLHRPDPGAYTVWDSLYGEVEYDEAFASVLPLEGGGVLAVGERRSIDGSFVKIVFVTFDRLGRKIEEKFYTLPGMSRVVKMRSTGEGGVVVAADLQNNGKGQVWLGFFDAQQNLKAQQVILDARSDYFLTDIMSSIEGGWVVSVSSRRNYGEGEMRQDVEDGLVFLLDKAGKELRRRSYSPGGNNRITGISVLKKNGEGIGYIATGYFINNAGKKIAWALRLDPSLSLNWQSEYGRGLEAQLNAAVRYRDDYILAFGDVHPANGKPVGAWLALLNAADGKVLWQRYYYGESGVHHHFAQDIFVTSEALIVLMMRADSTLEDKVFDEENRGRITDTMNYAHLLTLSPRGITIDGDAYFYGEGARIAQLVQGYDGERIMAGDVIVREGAKEKKHMDALPEKEPLREEGRIFLPDVKLSPKAKKGLEMLKHKIDEQEQRATVKDVERKGGLMRKGWVVVGDRPGAYDDPCGR